MDFIDGASAVDGVRWSGAGEQEQSPVNYSKRNIKCVNSDIIRAESDKVTSLGGEQQTGKRKGGRDGFAATCDL